MKKRTCLKCNKYFNSQSAGHRTCYRCKELLRQTVIYEPPICPDEDVSDEQLIRELLSTNTEKWKLI